MDPILSAGIATVSPYILDMFTGASKGVNDAQNKYQNTLQTIINGIKQRAGVSPTDSLLFKTGKATLDKNYRQANEIITQSGATTGMTDEAKLGKLGALNENYNTGTLNLLNLSEEERQRLMEMFNAYTLQGAQYNLSQAQQKQAGVMTAGTALSSTLSGLLSQNYKGVKDAGTQMGMGKAVNTVPDIKPFYSGSAMG